MNVLALARAAKEDPSLVATREEVSRQLAGNLCRCSGYESQLRAIVRFLNESGVQVGFEMPELPVNDTSCDGVAYKQITHKQPKKDSKALLEGRPVYTGDMVPAGALIVKLKRSPYARAKIRSIDTSRALKVPGVVGVYTYEDVPKRRFTIAGQSYPQPSPYDRLILENLVRYQNEEVAIVAAETEEAADKALKLIKVDYEVLEPLLDFTQALDNDIVVHPEGGVTFMFPQGGDVAAQPGVQRHERFWRLGRGLRPERHRLHPHLHQPGHADRAHGNLPRLRDDRRVRAHPGDHLHTGALPCAPHGRAVTRYSAVAGAGH